MSAHSLFGLSRFDDTCRASARDHNSAPRPGAVIVWRKAAGRPAIGPAGDRRELASIRIGAAFDRTVGTYLAVRGCRGRAQVAWDRSRAPVPRRQRRMRRATALPHRPRAVPRGLCRADAALTQCPRQRHHHAAEGGTPWRSGQGKRGQQGGGGRCAGGLRPGSRAGEGECRVATECCWHSPICCLPNTICARRISISAPGAPLSSRRFRSPVRPDWPVRRCRTCGPAARPTGASRPASPCRSSTSQAQGAARPVPGGESRPIRDLREGRANYIPRGCRCAGAARHDRRAGRRRCGQP